MRRKVADADWDVYVVDETHARVMQAIDAFVAGRPDLGQLLVDTISGSKIPNLKVLRPGTVRILFAFAPLEIHDPAGRRRQSGPKVIAVGEVFGRRERGANATSPSAR